MPRRRDPGERHQLRELAAEAGRETEGFVLALLTRVQNEEARRLAREARAVLADLAPQDPGGCFGG